MWFIESEFIADEVHYDFSDLNSKQPHGFQKSENIIETASTQEKAIVFYSFMIDRKFEKIVCKDFKVQYDFFDIYESANLKLNMIQLYLNYLNKIDGGERKYTISIYMKPLEGGPNTYQKD
jgi:hypothetical protein